MPGDKRQPSLSVIPLSSRQGALRVVESTRSIGPSARIAGVGQCLFLLFRDELLASRQRQRIATPARDVSHV